MHHINYITYSTTAFIIISKSKTSLSLVMGGIRTHNLLIFGQTPKPSCQGSRQEDSCLPKDLIYRVR